MLHRSAAASRQWQLGLGTREQAVRMLIDQPAFAEYPQAAFWTVPSAPAAAPAAVSRSPRRSTRQAFLLFPLSELVDEHYTVYFCKLEKEPSVKEPPRFCR